MLRITADIFSGRENPARIITDEQEVRTTLKEIVKNRSVLSQSAPVEAGLGFRGFIIEPLSDELAQDFELPASLYIAAGSNASAKANEIADRLISLMSGAETSLEPASIEEGDLPLGGMLQGLLQQQLLQTTNRVSVPDVAGVSQMMPVEAPGEIAAICTYETAPSNPSWWSDPPVCSLNNCYNFACGKRTDTNAQPGRGCGHMYTAINCAELTRAALCDGLHRRYDCFPPSEAPRYLVALAIAPGPSFTDFIWYRLMQGGFWAYKAGCRIRNVDNSGKVIYNPQTCNRGAYTIFCGYFYTCRSVKIK